MSACSLHSTVSLSMLLSSIYQVYEDIPLVYNIQLQISTRRSRCLQKLEEGWCIDAYACELPLDRKTLNMQTTLSIE